MNPGSETLAAGLRGLLTLRAFRPDPMDPAYTLQSRTKHLKSFLAFSIGAESAQGYRVRAKGGKKGSEWRIEKGEGLDAPYLTPVLLDRAREQVHSGWIALSFTPSNVLCELETGRLPEEASLQKALLINPKSILKNRYEQDRRYQIVAAADHKKYMSFSVPTREVVVLEKMVKDAGMEIVRLQIGLANMVEYAIRRIENLRQDGMKRIILVGDQSIILSMSIRDGIWEDTFSFVSRPSNESFAAAASVEEYLESLASEINESGVEFHLLHSHQCWWSEIAEKWFQQKAGRFTLVKMTPIPPFVEIQLLLER